MTRRLTSPLATAELRNYDLRAERETSMIAKSWGGRGAGGARPIRGRLRLLVVIASLTLTPGADALHVTVSATDVEHALQIAGDSDTERARFNSRYIFPVSDPSVEQFEVFTEFRRVVLAGQARRDDWMFLHSPRQAQDAVRQWRGKVTVSARLRFNPLNPFVSVPDYELLVESLPGEPTLAAIDRTRTPVYSALGNTPASVIVGAVIDATFEAASIGQTSRAARLLLDGKEQVRVTVDFARLE
jgi:hypothetical protein